MYSSYVLKYERICPLSSHILKKRTCFSNTSYFLKAHLLYFMKSYLSVKILNTPSYSYLQIHLNTLIYVIIVFIWKYAHT